MVKKEKAMIEKAKEYDKGIDFIDDVDISYDDLDVSAKTVVLTSCPLILT